MCLQIPHPARPLPGSFNYHNDFMVCLSPNSSNNNDWLLRTVSVVCSIISSSKVTDFTPDGNRPAASRSQLFCRRASSVFAHAYQGRRSSRFREGPGGRPIFGLTRPGNDCDLTFEEGIHEDRIEWASTTITIRTCCLVRRLILLGSRELLSVLIGGLS